MDAGRSVYSGAGRQIARCHTRVTCEFPKRNVSCLRRSAVIAHRWERGLDRMDRVCCSARWPQNVSLRHTIRIAYPQGVGANKKQRRKPWDVLRQDFG